LTSDAFRDALAKGQGRTVLVLQHSDPAPFVDPILAACVKNLQWDRQCEENRALYMMRLIDLAGLQERALDAILEALPRSEAGWDRDWMVDLLEEFARRGDAKAWETLRSLAESGYKRAQNNLATANEAGLEWVVANILPNMSEDERCRIGYWLPDEEEDDRTALQRQMRLLDRDNDARRDAVRRAAPKPEPKASDFFRSLDDPKAPYASPVDFERLADVRQWRKAARRLMRETEGRPLRQLEGAFRRGGFPLPAKTLFRQATHPKRGWAVMSILGTLDTASVRRFALGLLRRRPLPWSALESIAASLRWGDEVVVLAALTSTEGKTNKTRHNPILDVVGFMREHPKGRWQPHAEWIYEHSPCSRCRASAVRWMGEHGVLPEAIREEGAYDAEPDVREHVATKA